MVSPRAVIRRSSFALAGRSMSVEIRNDKNQHVLEGTHRSGVPYEWRDGQKPGRFTA